MGVMGFHGGEGWMPPLAAQCVGNADALQPIPSVSPCLPVKKSVGTP